ncbi:MAG: hypothetical protein AMS27_06730 [Bacteroides sp. SM23_62_1]|nr:MAG: hypothetical protein AMS27_06730 [Bacteroides sp. SM23_62_1]
MNIIEFLSIDSSRLNADLLVERFEQDHGIFNEILAVMYQDTYPLSMRASRVVWLIAKKYPDFIESYINEMINRLPSFKIDGVRRNILSILVEVPLPDIDPGRLFHICYTWLESENEPVAIRGNALTILYKISEKEPELKPELVTLFESLLPCNSAGIETRIKNYLKKLYSGD